MQLVKKILKDPIHSFFPQRKSQGFSIKIHVNWPRQISMLCLWHLGPIFPPFFKKHAFSGMLGHTSPSVCAESES